MATRGKQGRQCNHFVQMNTAPSSALHRGTSPNNTILPWYLLTKERRVIILLYSLLTHVIVCSLYVLLVHACCSVSEPEPSVNLWPLGMNY